MGKELVLYTNPLSRGRIARWMLEETGQPYRAELLDFRTTMKTPEYLAINPMGKVPALRHGDTVVTECGAICAYLAEAFPEAGLAPAIGNAARGPYLRWLFFGAGPIEAAIANKAMRFEVPTEREGTMGYGSMKRTLDTLEKALTGREFLAGERFTAADLYVASTLGFGLQFGVIEKRPVFESYVALHRSRPAAQRAAQIDNELMPKK